jgi:hypothetical protein
MATFSGRNSPTALAALAPSINNLAAAKNARSQAAAGLIKTMGVQFDKQKEKEARKQKNQAAQQVAEKLLQDPAFRRQAPGITDSAGLVKLIGADNVVKFGLDTQQADRVAQESATRINLTNKQIEKYETDARLAESNEASGKAFSTAVGAMFGEGFTQENLMAAIQGMNSNDAASSVRIYNERNPQDPLQEITVGGKTYIYSPKTGNAMLADDGSQLDKETASRLAAIDQMNISPEEKEKMKQGVLRFAAIPRDEFGDPAPGFGVGAAGGAGGAGGVPAGGPGGVPAGGPGGGGSGDPTGDPTARITLEGNLQTLFDKMPDNVLTDPSKVDGFLWQYRDKLSDEEKETFKRFVVQESIVTAEEKRTAALAAQIEANNPDKPGVVASYLKNLTIPFTSDPISSMIPDMDVLRKAYQDKSNELKSYTRPGAASVPGSQIVKGIKDYMMGGESQSSTPPKVSESQKTRPSPQINRAENLNPNQPRTSMLEKSRQGPLEKSFKRTVKDLSSRIKAYEDSGKSFNFNLAKQITREKARREEGRNAPDVVKELSKMTIDKINNKPKSAAEEKAQTSLQKVIMEMLELEGPITSYGDPRMQSSITPVE